MQAASSPNHRRRILAALSTKKAHQIIWIFLARNIKDFICRTLTNKLKILFLWSPFQNMSCCKVKEKQNTRLPGFVDANTTRATCFNLLASTLNLLPLNLLVFPKIIAPKLTFNPKITTRNLTFSKKKTT